MPGEDRDLPRLVRYTPPATVPSLVAAVGPAATFGVIVAMAMNVNGTKLIVMEYDANDSAKAGDQLGMFGEVLNTPGQKPTLDRAGETKGRAVGLFETDGDPDQILLFDDGVATADRTWKPNE